MLTKSIRYLLILSFALLSHYQSVAQGSQRYRSAIDLYEKGLYADAQQQLAQVRKETAATDRTMLSNIDYYDIMCAVRLKQPNAETLAQQYLDTYPESGRKSGVMFAVALSSYEKEKYAEAAQWFSKVTPDALNESEQGEYSFKYGYSLLKTKKSDKAADYFGQVKDSRMSRYAAPATFYYAHIAYENKNYTVALKHFESIQDEPEFVSIVPFYLLQIHFFQKEYDKVLVEGPKIYGDASSIRAAEVARMIAESYMQKKDYKSSLEWFEKYNTQLKGKLSSSDCYLMSLTYFELQRYDDAIALLSKQPASNDEMGQNNAYLLGASYLKTNDKQKAMTAFDKAAKIGKNKELTISSMLNYAKLQLEVNNDATALRAFVEKYPNSDEQDDVRDMLAGIYISDKKFKEAIALIQKAPKPTERDNENLQRAAYFNGLDLYKKGLYPEAEKNFDLSLKYASYDTSIASQANYWKAENSYRMGDYQKAKTALTEYLNTGGAFKNTTEYRMAHYTLGYCYFKENAYDDAITWFRKFAAFTGSAKTPFAADCYNRIGDCYFTQRKFDAACENYDKAFALKLAAPDYSLYQSAMSNGMAERTAKKKELMNSLITQFPQSSYVPAAWFELGRTSVEATQYAEALKSFDVIIKSYKKSTYYPKTLVEIGLIKVNMNQEDEALTYYKQVVEQYPSSSEAQDALSGIKNIYINKGNVNDYFAYTAGLGKGTAVSVSANEKDSLSFVTAERIYLQGDCTRSIPALEAYLKTPQPTYVLNATYYLGDCLYRAQRYEECLKPLAYVTSRSGNDYMLDALLKYGKACWELKDYDKAAGAFDRLAKESKDSKQVMEAQTDATTAYYLAENYPSVVNAATRLLSLSGLDEQHKREASFMKARALSEIGQTDDAAKLYETLSKDTKTAEGAEANYRLISILFGKGDYDKTEKAVIKFGESKTPYNSWLARSFIVLGDVYVKRGNFFQARETYKSIANGYKGSDEEIVPTAKERLTSIDGKE